MRVLSKTQTGLNKTLSEDRLVIGRTVLDDCEAEIELGSPPFIIAVADGVGGASAGALASEFVAKRLTEYPFGIALSADSIKAELSIINNSLIKLSKASPETEGMATTLSGIISNGEKTFIFHVGNTRVFGVFGGYLKQLTADHTTYEFLRMSGNLDAAEVCNKSEITACMGGGNPDYLSKLEIFEFEKFCSLERIVLTSDGVHDYADIDSLEALVSGDIDEKTCGEIVKAAILGGSHDDISVIIIDK